MDEALRSGKHPAQLVHFSAQGRCWVQERRPEPLQTSFKSRRLQRIGRADLHTLGAARTGSQESILRQCAGRPHGPVVAVVAPHRPLVLTGAGFDRRSPEQSGSNRADYAPFAQIDFGLRFRTRRGSSWGQAKRLFETGRHFGLDLNYVGRTNRFTAEALDAFADAVHLFLLGILVQIVVAAHARLQFALLAVDTAVHLDVVTQPGHTGDQGQQAAVWAQVAAPETLLVTRQRDDPDEHQQDWHAVPKMHGRHVPAVHIAARIVDRALQPQRAGYTEQSVPQIGDGRVEAERKGACDQGDRVAERQDINAEYESAQSDQKIQILPVPELAGIAAFFGIEQLPFTIQ